MYSYIRGIIDNVDSNGIVIDNHGIGYLVNVANPFSFKIGEEYKVYVYNQIREDEHLLFGFKTIEEKELFLKLISVKGLGPKIALGMFAANDMNSLISSIDEADVTYLTKYPKVGEKLARQIVLDLKGKLASTKEENEECSEELMSALINLGYKKADIKKVISKLDKEESLETQIKEALKLLLRG